MIAPATRLVVAPNPGPMTGRGTNTYLLGERAIAIVDPGPDVPAHVEAVLAAVPAGGRVVALLVTHGHADHLGAAGALRARTGAPIFGHAALPSVDRALGDGDEIAIGGRRVVALATPGHAPDHLCFWLPDDRLLFAGDLIAGVGTIVLADAPGSLARYLASLDRLRALGQATLLPGHGPIVADGRARVDEYLAHRAARERQILDALGEAPASVDELVTRLYAETPVALHPAAARNVYAHLDLLAERGRVELRSGQWHAIG